MSVPVAEEIQVHLQQIIDNEKRLNPCEVVERLDQINLDEIKKPLKANIKEVLEQDPNVLLMTAVSEGKNNALDVMLDHIKERPEVGQKVAMLEEASKVDNPGAIRVLAKHDQIDPEVKKATSWLVCDAVKCNKSEYLKELVAAGYSVDICDDKSAPIHIAAREGNVECAKTLIEAGCDMDVKSELNDPPFVEAVLTALQSQKDDDNDELTVAELLSNAGCDVNQVGLDGKSALHAATFDSNVKQIAFLIKTAKVDIDGEAEAAPMKGYTALQIAIQFTEKPEIVQMLVDAGCNIDKSANNKRETALHMAVRAPADVRDLYVEILLNAGVKIDVQDCFGNTPLHDCKHPGILVLLAQHAEPDVFKKKNSMGRTPLHNAVDSGFDAAVCMMLNKGADPSVADVAGDTVLHLASRDEVTESVGGGQDVKLQLTKVPEAFTSDVPYPLSNIMIGFGICLSTFNRLLEKMPDVDVQNKNGETSLHVAINHNCKRIVEVLLRADSDAFNVYDRKGLNAYDLATSKQGVTPEIIGMLEQRQSQHRVPFVNAIDMLTKLMKTVKLDPTLSKREKKTFDSAIMTLITLLKKNLPKDLAMPLEHRTILKRNRGMLIEEMVPKGVIECLHNEGVLDEDTRAEIEEEPGRRKKCEKLLDVLVTRGRRAFPAFCKSLNDTDQAFILELMQSKVETEIMKSDDSILSSEPTRGRPMINEHREFLRLNRGRLVQQMQMKTSNKLYKKLVSGGVLTNEMVEEIQQESSEEKQCERVLDILPTRGRNAFPLFCQVMEQEQATSQESEQVLTTSNSG